MEQPELNDTERLQRLYAGRVAARGPAHGAACVAPEAILAVVRREGPEEERLATLEHVMSCAACHREYEWLAAVDQAAEEAGWGTGAGRPTWWRRAPLALAATLAAAVGLGLLVQGRLRGTPDTVRGDSGAIALIAPAAGTAPAGALTFAWHPLAGASGYVLEVLRPDGAVALADTLADTTATLADPARVLPDADYRWWVRELSDGAEPRGSGLRTLRLPPR